MKLREYDTNALAQWRKDQERELTEDGGWLSIVALVWLSDGPNTLPAPLRSLGTLVRRENKITLVSVKGEETAVTTETPLSVGSVVGRLIVRGKRIGVRIYDSESAARKHFTGRKWLSPNPRLCVTAEFHPYPSGKQLPITNVLGDTQPVASPGYVTFQIDNKLCRLEAQETPNGLFFNFHDLTSGKETYPAGRFLETDKPINGSVTLDFNRAVNPPCAFTEFATCPLPPKQNFLSVAIAAGERATH